MATLQEAGISFVVETKSAEAGLKRIADAWRGIGDAVKGASGKPPPGLEKALIAIDKQAKATWNTISKQGREALNVMREGINAFGQSLTALPNLINKVRAFVLAWSATIFALYFAIGRLLSGITDFELNLGVVQRATSATNKEMLELRDTIFEISRILPIDQVAISHVAVELSKMGLTAEETAVALKSITKASVFFRESIDVVSEAVIGAIRLFPDLKGNIEEATATIIGASGAAILNLEKFQTAFSYLAGAASDLGFSFYETALAIAFTSESTLKASTIGTSLRRLLVELSKAHGQLAGAQLNEQKAIRLLNLDTQEFFDGLRQAQEVNRGFRFTLDWVNRGLLQLDDSMRDAAVLALFGVRAYSSLTGVLNKSSGELDRMEATIKRQADEFKKTQTILKNAGDAMTIIQNAFFQFRVEIVEAVTPALVKFGELIQSASEPFDKLAKVIGKALAFIINKIYEWVSSINFDEAIAKFENFITEIAIPLIVNLWNALIQVGSVVLWFANVIAGFLSNPAVTRFLIWFIILKPLIAFLITLIIYFAEVAIAKSLITALVASSGAFGTAAVAVGALSTALSILRIVLLTSGILAILGLIAGVGYAIFGASNAASTGMEKMKISADDLNNSLKDIMPEINKTTNEMQKMMGTEMKIGGAVSNFEPRGTTIPSVKSEINVNVELKGGEDVANAITSKVKPAIDDIKGQVVNYIKNYVAREDLSTDLSIATRRAVYGT